MLKTNEKREFGHMMQKQKAQVFKGKSIPEIYGQWNRRNHKVEVFLTVACLLKLTYWLPTCCSRPFRILLRLLVFLEPSCWPVLLLRITQRRSIVWPGKFTTSCQQRSLSKEIGDLAETRVSFAEHSRKKRWGAPRCGRWGSLKERVERESVTIRIIHKVSSLPKLQGSSLY